MDPKINTKPAYRPSTERTPLLRTEGGDGHAINSDIQKPQTFPSVLATFIAALGALSFGYALGFSSPATLALTVANGSDPVTSGPNMKLNKATLAWFGSFINIGAMVGGLLAGFLCDYVGRKLGLMICALPFCGGWALLAYAESVALLFAGRISVGLGVGMVSLMVPVYIAEVVSSDMRGTLGAVNQLSITIGVLVAYALGTILPYKWMAIVGIGLSAMHAFGMLFLPETPRWYLGRDMRREAKDSLLWLRGANAPIDDECCSIEQALESQETMSFKEFLKPGLLRPLMISLIMMVLQQWSGVNAVIFYAGTILETAGFSNANLASISIAGVQVVFTLIATLLMDRMGRRVLLIIAGSGMLVGCVAMGVYYEITSDHDGNPKGNLRNTFSPLAITAMLVYIAKFSLGVGAIPWLIMSEIFPNRARSAASGIATFTNWLNSFIVTLTFHHMQVAFGLDVVFWIYGGVCGILVVFVLFLVPETKGRSLEEIEELFEKPSIN
ncbi:solute carrier family 2, facilitated glucose transporter member 8-like [Sycon ciliatum]|uniref:solute carrier family 2, facilitated glucose transporter member 8-like n=1 Tax=Sycon ciliatum TaxID=27933 RepID=UPI0020ABE0AF|eukprot:scpid47574/ scgid19723/ Facilitated trehalose transporter Tret1